MGDLFGGGPSDGDIRRAEEKAAEKEAERLRALEIQLRRRESSEALQGSGIATTADVELGTDEANTFTGAEQVTGRAPAPDLATQPPRTADEIREAIMQGEMRFNFGSADLR